MMKKKQIFLKTIVAITLLSAMLVSLLLGMTNAEYLKSLSKKFDIELKPDLMLEYYLLDADTITSAYANYNPERGKYKNAKSFQQKIIIGKANSVKLENTAGADKIDIFLGDDVIYQIKIPVSETGYYTLNFTSEFLFADADEPTYRDSNKFVEDDFFTISHQYAVGCEVINSENRGSTVVFPTSKPAASSGLDMESRVFANNEYYKMPYYVADSAFQWKTLCPSRAENVKLSFKVTEEDVTNGYVVWAWELTGLKGGREYNFICKSLSAEKIMDLEGVSSSKPYFMLPSTRVTNNQVKIYGQVHPDDTNEDTVPDKSPADNGMDGTGYYERRGSSTPGITDYSAGRGTYVTEATSNSLGLRAETLGSGVLVDSTQNWYFDNPVSLMVPIKNVKYNTTYKVTFDMSVARQGTAGPNKSITSYNIRNDTESIVRYVRNGETVTSKTGEAAKNWWDYAEFQNIFNRPDKDALYHSDYSAPDNSDSNTVFYSYFHANTSAIDSTTEVQNVDYKSNNKTYSKSFTASRLSTGDLKSGLTSGITYANKGYQNEPLVKYDEVLDFYNFCNDTSKRNYPDLTTSTSVNDTYSIDYFNNKEVNADSTSMRNFFNAIQHTEINGQNAIRWITFYNTTFSFNIPESSNGSVNLDELYWVWAIHALEYESFYNIRIDNLRIEEVVEYTSSIAQNGVTIGGSQIGTAHMDSRGVGTGGEDNGVFNNYKGWNSTGQNFQARFHDPNKYMVNGNIYAPIIDAKKLPAAPGGGNGPNDYKIALSGWAVLKGGVQKYVWSADGGVTWHDMTFNGSSDTSVISEAQKGINQTTKQQTDDVAGGFIYNVFTNEDAVNNNFSNGTLIADISPYKHQADIDIIIAAVPEANNNFRCEILKIMNYNSANFYVSSLTKVKSDITVGSKSTTLEYDDSDFSISSATTGNSDIYNSGSCYAKYYPTFGRGVFTNQTAMSSRIDYTNLQTTCSDIPVKKELNIVGGIVCNRGVYSYEFSVDGGKTWTPIKHRNAYYTDGTNAFYKDSEGKYRYKSDDTVYNGDKDSITYNSDFDLTYGDGATETYEKLLYKFITRSTANDHAYFQGANGDFDEGGTRLFIDLSAYEGQIVDVIVAAKPNFQYAGINNITDAKTDIYLPIAKIDNVAVYGENGTFYSRIHTVYVDRDSASNRRKITPVNEDPIDKSYLNCSDNFAATNKGGTAVIGDKFSYTIFEVNNVNPRHMRFYNNSLNEMMSGGKITIDGYVMCHGGVKQYKFSLDGGKQWTVINDAGIDITSSAGEMYANSKKSDSTFALPDDGRKGDFCCTSPATDYAVGDYSDNDVYFQHALEFNLPALPAGSERNLLVVAEGNIDSDGDGEGNLYPVLAMKLKFKYKDGESSQYGYYRSTKRNGTAATDIRGGWVSENQSWSFTPRGGATDVNDNNTFNRMTVPVTQTGDFNLNLSHNMLSASTDKTWVEAEKRYKAENEGLQLYKYVSKSDYDGEIVTGAKVSARLYMDRKHFVQGEAIEVDWSLTAGSKFVNNALSGVTISIVSAEWKNASGNRHSLQFYSIPEGSHPTENSKSKSGSVTFQYDPDKGFNAGLPQHLRELPPGKYSIIMLNHGNNIELQWGDKDSTTGAADNHYKSWELARMDDIYIHPSDASLDITVLHDEGDETCFSNVNQLFNYSTEDDRIAGRYTVNPFVNSEITIPITVTEADVKRGYIILDINYTELLYKSITAPDEVTSGDKTTITVKRPGEKDQVHTKYPFTSVSYRSYPTLGTTPLVKRTS